MKNVIYFLLVCLFANITCCGQDTSSVAKIDNRLNTFGLPKNFSKEWKIDSTGCLHLREKYGHDIEKNLLLIGMSYIDFIDIFGIPNEKIDDKHLNYYTSADCDEKGKIALKPESFAFLTFYFKNGRLKAIGYSVA